MGSSPGTTKDPAEVAAPASPKRPWSVIVVAFVVAGGAYVLYDAIVTPVDVARPPPVSRGPILGLDDAPTRFVAPSPSAAASSSSASSSGAPASSAPAPALSGSTAPATRGTGD